jgi:hypothetical protein
MLLEKHCKQISNNIELFQEMVEITAENFLHRYVLKRLEKLRRSHFALCSLIQKIRHVFQTVLMFSVFFLFIDILAGLYFCCISFMDISGVFKNYKYMMSLNAFLWSSMFYARLANISWVCHTLRFEVRIYLFNYIYVYILLFKLVN